MRAGDTVTPSEPRLRRAAHFGLPFVDGRATSSNTEDSLGVVNPSTGRRIFSIPAGSATDVERAVVSARRAFQDGRWSDAPPSFRKKTLHQFAELISQHSEELNAL